MASPARPPVSLLCCLCGRQYGSASIAIHLRSCKERFLREEDAKPTGSRRPLPDMLFRENSAATAAFPGERTPTGASASPHIQQWNDEAASVYRDSMSECAFCARRFLPEKLEIHNRSCTAERPARRGSCSPCFASQQRCTLHSVIHTLYAPRSKLVHTVTGGSPLYRKYVVSTRLATKRAIPTDDAVCNYSRK